jgi:hypothetical protein
MKPTTVPHPCIFFPKYKRPVPHLQVVHAKIVQVSTVCERVYEYVLVFSSSIRSSTAEIQESRLRQGLQKNRAILPLELSGYLVRSCSRIVSCVQDFAHRVQSLLLTSTARHRFGLFSFELRRISVPPHRLGVCPHDAITNPGRAYVHGSKGMPQRSPATEHASCPSTTRSSTSFIRGRREVI